MFALECGKNALANSYQAARRFAEDCLPDKINCSSSSPLRTAVIKVSMTVGSLSSDGTAIAAFRR